MRRLSIWEPWQKDEEITPTKQAALDAQMIAIRAADSAASLSAAAMNKPDLRWPATLTWRRAWAKSDIALSLANKNNRDS